MIDVVSRDACQSRHQRHLHALDGVRGIAALWVVLFHVPWASHLTQLQLVHSGYLAVDLFFILSGFVIARSYGHRLRNGEEVAVFAWRRLFRLYPLYLVVLLGMVGLEVLKLASAQRGLDSAVPPFTGPNSVSALVANLALAQGWLCLPETSWNAPAWSTSVEITAYGLFALATWAGLTRRTGVLAVAAGLGLAADAVLAVSHGTLDLIGLPGLLRGLGGFSVGLLIERLSATDRLPAGVARTQMPLLAALLVVASLGGAWVALAPVLFALLVVSLQNGTGPLQRPLSSPLAQHLGRMSYALYLIHFPLFLAAGIVVKRLGGAIPPGDLWRGDALVLALIGPLWLAAWLAHRYVEDPARRFGATRGAIWSARSLDVPPRLAA